MSELSAAEVRSRLHHGLIPAVPVPFRADGRIDAEAQKRYAAHMAEQPVAGVAVWAHTGRGLHLTRDQRLLVLETWRSALGPPAVIVAGVGASHGAAEDLVGAAVAMAQDAADHGAEALLVHPPSWLRPQPHQDDRVLEYHQRLATAGLPLVLFYLYEAAGGISYSFDLLRRLLTLPEVVGIKVATLDSVMTFQDVASLLAAEFPDKLLITGEDRFLGYSLMCGAQAALIGMGAACTEFQLRLLRAHFRGQEGAEGQGGEFLRLSRHADRLAQTLFVPPMEGYIRRVLWALVHLGVFGSDSAYDPWGPGLPETEFGTIGRTLDRLLRAISS